MRRLSFSTLPGLASIAQALRKKRYSVALALVALLVIVPYIAFPLLIDEDRLRNEMEAQLSKAVGYGVTIRHAEVSFLGVPQVTFRGVMIDNAKDAATDKLLSAQQMQVDFSLPSLLGGELQASRLSIKDAIFEIQELEPDSYNFRPLALLSQAGSSASLTRNVTLIRTEIRVSPYDSEGIYKLFNTNGSLAISEGGEVGFEASFQSNGDKYSLTGNGNLKHRNDGSTLAFDMSLRQGNDTISYSGNVGLRASQFFAKGTASLDLSGLAKWPLLFVKQARSNGAFDILKGDNRLTGTLPLTLKNGMLTITSEELTFNRSPLDIKTSVSLAKRSAFSLKADLQKLDLEADLGTRLSHDKLKGLFNTVMRQSLEGTVELHLGELHYGDINARDVSFEATIMNGELILNRAVWHLGGDTQLLAFGILKQDVNNNVQFDGNMELLGSDIQRFMDAIRMGKHKLLAAHQGRFRAKSNLFASEELMTFSSLRFQAGDFLADGAVEYRPEPSDGKTHYTAGLTIDGGNMSSLAKYFSPLANRGMSRGIEQGDLEFAWLDAIKRSYNLKLTFNDFKLYDQKGQKARVKLVLRPQVINVESLDIELGKHSFKGRLSYDQSQDTPYMDAQLSLSSLPVDHIVGSQFRNYPVARGNVLTVWDDSPLDYSFLQGYDGSLDLSVRDVTHDSFAMKNVRLQADIEDGVWNIRDWTGDIWNGTFDISGKMDTRSLLALDMQFKLKDILMHRFLSSFLNIKSLRGRANINGSFETAGSSIHNFVKTLSANIAVAGSDVTIRGFNVPSLLQALPSVRNTSEIANTVRVALTGGQTRFDVIQGGLHIDNGKMKAHGLKLRSRRAIGTMTGSADLTSWSMDYSITFKLPTLATRTMPTLTVYLRDSMDNPRIQFNTRDLESFMTQQQLNR